MGLVWMYRHLLDVAVGIHHIRLETGDRTIGKVGEDPQATGPLGRGQFDQRRRLGVGDRVHAEGSEGRPGGPFDLPEEGKLLVACISDHGPMLAAWTQRRAGNQTPLWPSIPTSPTDQS